MSWPTDLEAATDLGARVHSVSTIAVSACTLRERGRMDPHDIAKGVVTGLGMTLAEQIGAWCFAHNDTSEASLRGFADLVHEMIMKEAPATALKLEETHANDAGPIGDLIKKRRAERAARAAAVKIGEPNPKSPWSV